jgi:acyl-CoA synthetase (AMP-forming)/AMP-acid ligase II
VEIQRLLTEGRAQEWAGWLDVVCRGWREGKAREAAQGLMTLRAPDWKALWAAARAGESLLSLAVRWRGRAQPDEVAVEGEGGRRTWGDLNQRADRLARALTQEGIRSGDVVAVMLPNGALWIEAALAVGRLGGRFLPVSTHAKGAELGYVLADSGAKLLLLAESARDVVGDAWRQGASSVTVWLTGGEAEGWGGGEVEEKMKAAGEGAFVRGADQARGDADDQVIMYTSGTTGKPKGAARSVRDVGVVEVLNLVAALHLSFREVLYVCTPLYHAAPWALSALVLGVGGRLVLADGWRGEDSIAEMGARGVTAWLVVPTLVKRWLDLPANSSQKPSTLQRVYSTGAQFPAAWKRAASARFGPVFFDFYGATEAGVISVADPRDCVERPETVGKILPHIQVRIDAVAGEASGQASGGSDLGPGSDPSADSGDDPTVAPSGVERGTLYVRGQNFLGYTRAGGRVQRADAFIPIGDIATLDGRYLSIVGRAVDLVISGGVNIYPAEVEAALRTHPSVGDVAVIGTPDEVFGEALAAFVVPKVQGLTAQALVTHCDAVLSRLKRPKHFIFMHELPISPQGKVLKRALRARWDAMAGREPSP